MKTQKSIETKRLLLRPFTLEDAKRVQELADNELLYKTTLNLPYPYTIEMAYDWISSHYSNFTEGKGFVYAVCKKDDNLLIGTVSITCAPHSHVGEIGYWVGVDYWNNGYCTEAAKAAVRYGFEEYGFHKIRGRHFKENPSSGRVLEKCGMTLEGELVDEALKAGKYMTLLTYGIINTT